MDSVRSAEKSRRKARRLQDLNDINFGNQEEKSVTSSRFGSVKTSPELEALPKHWAIVSEGFPPGVTVDELKNYGRRKQLSHLRPQDNLRLEEGSLKAYKSEYKRRYLPFCLPKVFQISEENPEEKTTEQFDLLTKPLDYNFLLERPTLLRPPNNLFILKDHPMESITEKNSQYVPFPQYEKRKLLRRSTALRPEGEIASETEVRKEYIDFKNPEKVRIIRKLPSLKLEGECEPMTTEQRDKFITYLLSKRPVLEKKKTSLKMEGNFDFLTEKKLNYVPHQFPERPHIRKRSTSLKLEGEVEFSPEYKNSFVDFPRTRPLTYKPNGKLRHEGEFVNQTETKTQFVNFENVSILPSAKPENNLHIEGEMEISPEYRNNFIDFPRERPLLRKPFNQLKPEGQLELLTESTEKYSNVGEPDKSMGKPSGENSPPEEKEPPVETSKEVSDPKPEEEDILPNKFGFLIPEKPTTEKPTVGRRPLSLRQEREYFFSPEYKQFNIEKDFRNLKPMEDLKSNSSSPRKKLSKEKSKFSLEDGKKSNPETPRRKASIKRLKETSPEKAPPEILTKSDEKNREANQLSGNLRFSQAPHSNYTSPKEYPAFKVLDVKGQFGCQSMMKDVSENEKLTSDEENPTYRLEVYNAGEGSPGFHKNNRRVFPSFPLDSKLLEEAELRAKQRAENYVKIVKSPEIANSLLEDDSDLEGKWKVSGKSPPLDRSFVVLDESAEQNSVEDIFKRERKGWLPDSLDSILS